MANLTEVSNFDAVVYELATSDPVLGGPGGVANSQAQALANRTQWLKDRIAKGLSYAAGVTGTPSLPYNVSWNPTTDYAKAYNIVVGGSGVQSTFTLADTSAVSPWDQNAVLSVANNGTSSGYLKIQVAAGSALHAADLGATITLRPGDRCDIAAVSAGVYVLLAIYRHDAIAKPGDFKWAAYNSVPTGYLATNGAAVSRTTYADLFAAIGVAYGVGDGSTTFNLPDTRGEFIRGIDNGRGVDSGRVFGASQSELIKDHVHIAGVSGTFSGASSHSVTTYSGPSSTSGTDATSGMVSGGGAETRPRNITMLGLIKY